MTEQYTPTTEEVREYVEVGGEPRPWEEVTPESESKEAARAAAFDRWLAAHDAQVRADALREAGDGVLRIHNGTSRASEYAHDYRDWLLDEAERIGGGDNE